MNFHAKSIPDVFSELQTSAEGLSFAEAKKRLAKHGRNVLPTTGGVTSRMKVFLSQWKSPLIIILVLAGAASGFLGETTDMAIIFITVGINTIVGFLQEDKANQSLKKLQSMVKYQAVVLRDGKKTVIPSEEVVPGDILFLSAGDKVQADGRVIKAVELRVNEAPLTGESLPVKKNTDPIPDDRVVAERSNMVYRGTAITDGECMAVVTKQGEETELGRIATLVQKTAEEQTPLQIQLARIARQIGWVVVGIAVFIFIVGEVFAHARYSSLELFETSVAVAVAAIPEGLVISLTVVLAVGMQQILKRQALVRRMLAAETLGSVSVICTDKTGTLTIGDMRVSKIATHEDMMDGRDLTALHGPAGAEHADIALGLRMAVLASNATLQNPDYPEKEWKFLGDTTEAARVRAVDERSVKLAYAKTGGTTDIKLYKNEFEFDFSGHGKTQLSLPREVRERLKIGD
jgi:Ca2+-transporting ATPase